MFSAKPLLALLCAALALAARGAPSAAQLENLTRGVNVAWFAPSDLRFDETIARQSVALINRTGVRHVRLHLATTNLASPETPSSFPMWRRNF